MSQYRIETVTPDGKPIIVPIPDGFLEQIAAQHPVRRELWELIGSGAGAWVGVYSVIQILERHGWHCPDDLKEEG